MSVYVERNPDNSIKGLIGRATQPYRTGWERLADDDPELVAFVDAKRNPPAPDPAELPDTAEDLVRAALSKGLLTRAELDQAKRDRGKPLP